MKENRKKGAWTERYTVLSVGAWESCAKKNKKTLGNQPIRILEEGKQRRQQEVFLFKKKTGREGKKQQLGGAAH